MYYSVSIFLKAIGKNGGPESIELWEERVYLILATDETDAKAKGEKLGKLGEHEYRSSEDRTIRWVFDCVNSVCEVGDERPSDGAELFSRFLRSSDVQSLKTPFEGPPGLE